MLLFSYVLVTFGPTPKVTFSLLFRYFEFFGVSGSVGPFAPHKSKVFPETGLTRNSCKSPEHNSIEIYFGKSPLPARASFPATGKNGSYRTPKLFGRLFSVRAPGLLLGFPVRALQKLLPATRVIWALRAQSWKKSRKMSSRGPGAQKVENGVEKESKLTVSQLF